MHERYTHLAAMSVAGQRQRAVAGHVLEMSGRGMVVAWRLQPDGGRRGLGGRLGVWQREQAGFAEAGAPGMQGGGVRDLQLACDTCGQDEVVLVIEGTLEIDRAPINRRGED